MDCLTILLIFICFKLCLSYQDTEDLTLRINDGVIIGRYITSDSGRSISAFMGIPFARPPVGDLRFRAPQKAVPWNGSLLTQNEPAKCPQIDNLFASTSAGFEGEEDCLYLNVYVPEKTTGERLDVLVWIYGGGFAYGSGIRSSYGPDYLLDHDVILVSGNYRVGHLGFLSTEDEHAPGNFGMKDQVLLLHWVQDNIEHFGGNKNSVTIWGESAGAISVNYHMLSPMSRGLFHKAILHSGTVNNAWTDPPRRGVAKQQAINLAQHVNCPTEGRTTEEIVECLRTKTPEEIVDFRSIFQPVIEYSGADEDAFIGERNFEKLHSNSVDIPILLGINSEEGLRRMTTLLVNNSQALDFSTWNESLSNWYNYGHLSASEQEEITKKINAFYLGRETTPTNQLLDRQQLINLFTDGSFIGVVQTIKQRLSHINHHTYLYHFTHKGTSSFSTTDEFFGTTHLDDLIPLFPLRKTAFYSSIPTAQDKELTKRMSLMWTNFVKTGNPTPDNTMTPIWPLAKEFPLSYLQIGNENGKFDSQLVQPRIDFYPSRANFWIELRNEHRINSWLEDNLDDTNNSSKSSCYSLSMVGYLLFCWYFLNKRK